MASSVEGGAPRPPSQNKEVFSYAELSKDSLKAAKMDNGLQTGAIYWEINMNSYKGAFGTPTYGQKWTWKVVDDAIRTRLG